MFFYDAYYLLITESRLDPVGGESLRASLRLYNPIDGISYGIDMKQYFRENNTPYYYGCLPEWIAKAQEFLLNS
jgi:hypothetical protein